MARVASVSMLRGESQARSTHPLPGTKLRLVYDTLYEHRGHRIPPDEERALLELVTDGRKSRVSIPWAARDLVEFYGCDVRGSVLVGEWFGRVYVDYTRPAEEQAARLDTEVAPRAYVLAARDALLGCRPGGSSASLELVV